MKTIEDNGPEPTYRPGDRVRLRYPRDTVATIVRAIEKSGWDVWKYELECDDPRPGLPTITFGNLVEPLEPAQEKGKPMATPLPNSVARGTPVVFAKPASFRGKTIAAGTRATYDDPAGNASILWVWVLLPCGTRFVANRDCLALHDGTAAPQPPQPPVPGDWIESICDNFGDAAGFPENLPRGRRTRVTRIDGRRFFVEAFCSAVSMNTEGTRWKRCDSPLGEPAASSTPETPETPETLETQEPKQPQPKKEDTMNPIRIANPILVNGLEAKDYSAAERSRLLADHENEIKRLEGLEFKTQETRDEIAALRAGVVAAIAEFDREYAERKAAAK